MNCMVIGRVVVLALLLTYLGGCAGPKAFKEGEALQRQGKYDEAVTKFADAVASSPDNQEYRLNLIKSRGDAAWHHIEKGRTLVTRQQYDQALFEFRQAQALDSSMVVAGQEIGRTEILIQSEKLINEAESSYRARRFSTAKNNLAHALELTPGNRRALELLEKVQEGRSTILDGFELEVSSDTPITLNFKSAQTKEVFNILSQLSGINFIFDEEMREQSVSLSLENASFAQALELLLKLNDLSKKVLNSKTIIIYSNTKEKGKQYDDQIIQTFYLSYIDAKKAVNLLRTMLQLRKIYVHEELNALVVRDKPDVIKLAQQILEAADRGDSEVVLDLELVEITHTDELNIGPSLSSNSVSFGLSNPGSGSIVAEVLTSGTTTTSSDSDTTTGVSTNLVTGLSNLQTFYTLPTLTYDVLRTLTDSEILANPSIRVKNKEKAKVHIGSREPVITVTVSSDTTSESIQYVDVGVKLDVEPTIQLDSTVLTKVELEVSNATRLTELSSGTTPLQITTTSASTSLILKDGEQTIIGGLLRDDQSKSKSMIPFLGEIPLLGKLFTGHSNSKTKREILLSITPHIVKRVELPNVDVASIWSGGEDDLKAGPNFGSFAAFKPELEEPPLIVAPALMPTESVSPGAIDPESLVPMDSAGEAVADYAEVVEVSDEGAPSTASANAAVNTGTPLSGSLPEAVSVASPAAVAVVAPSPESAQLPTIPTPAASAASVSERIEQVTMAPPALPKVAERARIYLSGSGLVDTGKEFTLDVIVDEVVDLYSAPLFVRFDPQQLTFVKAEEGDFLKQGGTSTLFTTSVNNDKGELIVGHKQGLGGAGVSGGGKLFRLVFKAHSAGQTQVGFDRINFRNPAGNRLVVLPMSFTLDIR